MSHLKVLSNDRVIKRQPPAPPPYFNMRVVAQWDWPKQDRHIEEQIRFAVESAPYNANQMALIHTVHMAVGYGSRYACFPYQGRLCVWYVPSAQPMRLVARISPCCEEQSL